MFTEINKYKKIIVLFAFVVIITVTVTAINMRMAYDKSVTEGKTTTLDSAKVMSANIESFVNSEIASNEAIATYIGRNSLEATKNFTFRDMINNDVIDRPLGYYDNSGSISFLNSGYLSGSDVSLSQYILQKKFDDRIAEAVKSKSTVISDFVPAQPNGVERVFFIFSPVYGSDETYKGVVFTSISTNELFGSVSAPKHEGNKRNYFEIGADGTWLYSNILSEFKGHKYTEYEGSEQNTLANSNISRAISGEEFSNDHHFISDERNSKGHYVMRDEIVSFSPVIIRGRLLMTTGVSMPKSAYYYVSDYLFIQNLIFVLFFLVTVYMLLIMFNIKNDHDKYRAKMEEKLKHAQKIDSLNKEIEMTQFEVIKSLVKLIEMKDIYTAGHSERVTEYAVGFATFLGYSNSMVNAIKYAAILHDIGKIGVPEAILNKKGHLTEEELSQIKEHPYIGYMALKDISFLKEESNILLHHHERMDGKGYPEGLAGRDINGACKVLELADAYDAMTSDRVYRKSLTMNEAISEIRQNSGTQFDREMAEKFIDFIKNSYIDQAGELVQDRQAAV